MFKTEGMPAEVKKALLAKLPGYDIDHMQIVLVPGTVTIETADAAQIKLASEAHVAAPPMVNVDGNPTILRVSAWMAHADVPNRNGAMFVRDELEALSGSLWQAPNLGVMDWNHSAIMNEFFDTGDPEVIGVWYNAEFVLDEHADSGNGAWGLRVDGMMWAWLFPSIADAMVAEQARNDSVNFSMAAIPKSVDFVDDTMILHDPVFLTNSALDVPPADPDAIGIVTEDPEVTPEELTKQLVNKAAVHVPFDISNSTTASASTTDINPNGTVSNWQFLPDGSGGWAVYPTHSPVVAQHEELTMDHEEIVAELEAKLEEAETKLNEITRDAATDELATKLADAEAEVARLTTENEEFATSLEEAKTSKEALAGQLEEANASIETLTAAVEELTQRVEGFEADEAEAAATERLAERLEDLPEHFQEAHAKRDEESRVRVESKWSDMDDETWESYKNDELLAYAVVASASMEDRSAAEGDTLGGGSKNGSRKAAITALLKRNQ